MINNKNFFFAASISILFASCNSNQNPLAYQEDAHGRGKATILIEESFKPLFDTSIYTFESKFPKADIEPVYQSELKVIEDFYANKAKTIVISRDFTEEEKAALKSKNVEVRSDKIALDAVALILHPSNTDTLMTVDQLKKIISGKQTTWTTSKKPITVVYDQPNSANFNYLKNLTNGEVDKKLFAANSNEEVINYVKKNPNAIGVIGLNWISDEDDFNVLDFLEGIKVVHLAKDNSSDYFQPFSGLIYTGEYPLIREIWMVNKGSRAGLNSGFVNFMVGELGQTLIQKCSLVPARSQIRLIEMRTE